MKAGKGFTTEHQNFCALHLERRNKELHSGSTEMAAEKNSVWLPSHYEASQALLGFLGSSLEIYIGPEVAKTAQQLIDAAKDESAKSVLGAIAACATAWKAKPAEERETLAAQAGIWASRASGHRHPCPACGCTALLSGTPAGPATRKINGDNIIEKQPVLPTKFECIACGLKVAGLSKLAACGMGELYSATTTYPAAEYYSQRYDQYEGYDPDFNEY